MKEYWIGYYKVSGCDWMISGYLGFNEIDIVKYFNEQPFQKTLPNVRVFRCECDPTADILTVAQQLVWERNGDVQRFINQETLNAS